MAKIYIVRDVLTGGIAKAFRNKHKADGYREFLDPPIQRPTHAVDEVELDEELPPEDEPPLEDDEPEDDPEPPLLSIAATDCWNPSRSVCLSAALSFAFG